MSPLLTVRLVQVVLWLLVVSGPLAAIVLSMQVSALDGRLDAVDDQVGVEVPPDTAGAEGFAELFIATYLSTGEDTSDALAPFLDDVPLDGVADGSWLATRTASLGARALGPGYFAVTVAAEVVAADPEAIAETVWVPVGTRFYTVGVAETDTGWAVTGLPTLVAAPPRAVSPELSVGRLDGLDEASGLEEMMRRFLAALLAGDGELARYTAPASSIVAIQPPPFVHVEILEAGLTNSDVDLRQVAAVVRATDAADRVQVLAYTLVVAERDGRWEVSELLPAPPLAPQQTN